MSNKKRRISALLADDVLTPLLTEDDKASIVKRASEIIAKEARQKQEDEFFEQELARQRASRDPTQTVREIMLDLAPHSDRIMIDGIVYFHGQRYQVSEPLYCTLKDIMARGWEHEAEVGGVNRDQYRPVPGHVLSPRSPHGTINSTRTLRGGGV